MTYEELIKELCDVIKESEENAISIYDNLESIETTLNSLNIPMHKLNKLREFISNSYGLLQHQDLHRQKIERVVNFVCENKHIDSSKYNLASSAKHIAGDSCSEEVLSADELEALIQGMKN